jgi:hypothetical protein
MGQLMTVEIDELKGLIMDYLPLPWRLYYHRPPFSRCPANRLRQPRSEVGAGLLGSANYERPPVIHPEDKSTSNSWGKQ